MLKSQLKSVCLILFLISCVSGPETEKKSPLNYLNGEHYEAGGVTLGGIPLSVRRRVVPVTIKGHVVVSKENFETRSRWTRLALFKDDVLVTRFQSDEKGRFMVKRDLPSGSYEIRPVDDKKYTGNQLLLVNSYEHNVKVTLKRTTP